MTEAQDVKKSNAGGAGKMLGRLIRIVVVFGAAFFGILIGGAYWIEGKYYALDMVLPKTMPADQKTFVSAINALQVEYNKKDNDLHRSAVSKRISEVICGQSAVSGFKDWVGHFIDVDRNDSSYDLYFDMPGLKSPLLMFGTNHKIILKTEGTFDFLGEAYTSLMDEEHYGLEKELPVTDQNTALLTSLELHQPIKISGVFARDAESKCLQKENSALWGFDETSFVVNISKVGQL